jgi:hypothetical protein
LPVPLTSGFESLLTPNMLVAQKLSCMEAFCFQILILVSISNLGHHTMLHWLLLWMTQTLLFPALCITVPLSWGKRHAVPMSFYTLPPCSVMPHCNDSLLILRCSCCSPISLPLLHPICLVASYSSPCKAAAGSDWQGLVGFSTCRLTESLCWWNANEAYIPSPALKQDHPWASSHEYDSWPVHNIQPIFTELLQCARWCWGMGDAGQSIR